MNYPDPNDLRAQAARIEAETSAVSDQSEYPRLATYACKTQVTALRNLAETIEETGGGIPEKRPGMTGEERRERRAAILRLRAARLAVKSAQHNRASHDIGSRIPFGQPILVGHHSERGHRRAIERMQRQTENAYAASKYAEDLERRADSVERSHAIAASDSDAVEAYRDKLRRLIETRDRMKAVNSAWRKNDTAALEALGFDANAQRDLREKIAHAYSWERQPYVAWQLTNLGATIRDTAKKLARLEQNKAQPRTLSERLTEGGIIRLEDNPQDNRVRLFYPGKPAPEIRTELKGRGFRWAPSLGCWQAFRNWRAMSYAYAAVGKEYAP